VKTILAITSKYLPGYKIMLIFNIKTEQRLTGNYLALEKDFFLRINRPGTQETTK
jgi:hypothetical protein